jgi:arylsulfatase A-like enzyme
MRQRWSAIWSAVLVMGATLASVGRPEVANAASSSRPNIVVVVTDDQRYDQRWTVTTVTNRLAAMGLTAARAFVSTPLCSPARATLLTGRYAHSTGVYANGDGASPGGFADFRDGSTIATWLHAGGYRTGLFGKYINHYERPSYVPPGWDRWVALAEANSRYYDYRLSVEGRPRWFGHRPRDYLTDVIKRFAASFIRNADKRPFFAWVGTPAPHGPNLSPPRYEDLFQSLRHAHHPNYDEGDVRDKPRYIRTLPRLDARDDAAIDAVWRKSARSLLAVDDLVAKLLNVLRDTGELRSTLFVFTSDNGHTLGEHRWRYKNDPHEETIRVPLLFRWPRVIRGGSTTGAIVGHVDLAPTLAAAAGVRSPNVEGMSLLPLLRGHQPPRHRLLLEHMHYGAPMDPPSYGGVRTSNWVFVHYATGEEELYQLDRDPYELRNLWKVNGYQDVAKRLRGRTRSMCDPRPPHLPKF